MFDDGLHVVYLNCSCADDGSPLGDLAHDFRCADPTAMRYATLRERAECLKSGGEETATMMETLREYAAFIREPMLEECKQEAMREAQKKIEAEVKDRIESSTEETALRMLRLGRYSTGEIAECLAMPQEAVEKLARRITSA